MTQQAFKVSPVKRYDGARYPSAFAKPVDDAPAAATAGVEEEEQRLSLGQVLRAAFMMMMVAALSFGLVACFSPEWAEGVSKQLQAADAGSGDGGGGTDANGDDHDIMAGVMVECTPGDVVCTDENTLQTCSEDYYPETVDCNDWCQAEYGAEYGHAWSNGCDASAAEPCQCDYDMIDGGMPACYPGEVTCVDDYTMQVCDENYAVTITDCNEHCAAQDPNGWGWSAGCDATAEDPCQCQFDMVAGVMAECTPGDVMCSDEQTLMTCTADYYYEYQSCNEYCQASLGDPYAYSLGCNAAAEDPCQCEYDIIDGDVAECTPGDIYCSDANTAQVCNEDHWSYTAHDCTTFCSDTHGPGFTSMGCDATTPDNFCGCKEEDPT